MYFTYKDSLLVTSLITVTKLLAKGICKEGEIQAVLQVEGILSVMAVKA